MTLHLSFVCSEIPDSQRFFEGWSSQSYFDPAGREPIHWKTFLPHHSLVCAFRRCLWSPTNPWGTLPHVRSRGLQLIFVVITLEAVTLAFYSHCFATLTSLVVPPTFGFRCGIQMRIPFLSLPNSPPQIPFRSSRSSSYSNPKSLLLQPGSGAARSPHRSREQVSEFLFLPLRVVADRS